jgi:hypothetical protein
MLSFWRYRMKATISPIRATAAAIRGMFSNIMGTSSLPST